MQEGCAPSAWPRVSRERHEIQANRCKRLLDHGALHSNSGRQKVSGADRPPQRQRAPRDPSLESAHKRVDRQAEARQAPQAQVAESQQILTDARRKLYAILAADEDAAE